MKTSKNYYLFFYPLVVIAVVILFVFIHNSNKSAVDKTYTYEAFISDVLDDTHDSDWVEKEFLEVVITPRQTLISIKGRYQLENETSYYSFSLQTMSTEITLEQVHDVYLVLQQAGVKTSLVNIYQQNVFLDFIIGILPSLLICLIAIYIVMKLMSSAGSGNKAFDFGRSRARSLLNSSTTFADVAGCEEEKLELTELVDYLKAPVRFATMGAKFPKGVILQGPPGTGKTLLARAVAGEANAPFLYISGSDFVEMFVGVGASRVRDMFRDAKSKAPCIVFIDEIDAVGRQRGTGLGGGNDEREQTLNQLLVELDGFEENSGILVIAATNRADVLDPALLRPGRFDRQITVDLPDRKAREEILKVHARNKKISSTVDFSYVASITPGLSGAELANAINEAAILAVRRGKTIITMDEINEGIDRTAGGLAKTSRKISDHERKLIAYHEAGHAVIGLKVAHSNIVQKVTMIPRGSVGGYVLMTPKEEPYLLTKGELKARIVGFLGGRTSEEIFFDDVTTGAQSDIQQATKIARLMVMELGMSNLGLIQYGQSDGQVFLGRDYTSNNTKFSAQIAYEIDKAIREIIEECRAEARRVLEENRDLIILIAETLLERETLSADEIEELATTGHLESSIAKKRIEDEENQREEEKARQMQQAVEEEKMRALGAIRNFEKKQ